MLECPSCQIAYDSGVYSTECPHNELPPSLEERVEALEKALKAQDSVHKLTIGAIARGLRSIIEELDRWEDNQ